VLSILPFVLLLSSGLHSSPVELVRSDDNGVDLRAETRGYNLEGTLDGSVRIEAPGYDLGSPPGEPWLPWRKVHVAVPPGVDVRLAARPGPVKVHPGVRLWAAPAPAIEGVQRPEWTPPAQWVELLELGYMRDQRVAVCAVRPFLYDSTTATLRVAEHIEVELVFDGAPGGVPRHGGRFERVYRELLINYQSSRAWRRARPAGEKSTWIPPFPSRKLRVVTEGIYRLTYEDLAPHLPVDDVNPHRFALWRDGAMVPLYVSGQDDPADTTFASREYVQFYGTFEPVEDPEERLAPVPGHFTDEAVYWLCWDEESPARMLERDATPTGAPLAASFRWVAHAETNTYPNRSGHGTAEPDEWYWGSFFGAGEQREYDIEVPSPAAVSDARLRMHLVGYSYGAHAADLWINGTWLATIEWQGGIPFLWESDSAGVGPVPVVDGTNTVTLVADQEDAYFFVDWIEIVYRRDYQFSDGRLCFRGPADEPTDRYLFRLQGAGSSPAEVLDVLNGERLVGIQVGEAAVFEAVAGGSSYLVAFLEEHLLDVEAIAGVEEEIPRYPLLSDTLENGCDYLIITHQSFLDASSDLKGFWEAERPGLSVEVVEVQDVYDEFSFGVFHPLAIRDFLAYAYAHWGQVPSYVLLVGDACWDYRGYLGATTKQNFVPSWGIPVQDNVLFDVDGGDPFADFFGGRFPVETPQQASNLAEKVVDYTQDPPEGLWRKTALFVNGGFDLDDAAMLEGWSEELISNWVEPPPFIGKPVRVYKGNENYWPHFYNARTRAVIDSGCVVVGFMGHGATHTWDLMFENEDLLLLENGDMLPFVLSPTCFTGDFGDHQSNVFGEDFLRRDEIEHGAIGFWGSSGLASESDMRLINGSFMSNTLNDAPWTNGEACYVARMAGSNTMAAKLFNLLGDPLATVAVPDLPELVVAPDDIRLDREAPGEGETVRVTATLHNWGLETSDSSTVLLGTDGEQVSFTKRLGPFGLQTDVALDWDTSGLLGERTLWVTMDALGEIQEIREDNNYADRTVTVLSPAPPACLPLDCAFSTPDSLEFVVANIDDRYGLTGYRFQLDTLPDFDSPWLVDSGILTAGPRVTSWAPSLGAGVTLWWRSRGEGPDGLGAWGEPHSVTLSDDPSGTWIQTSTHQFGADSLWQAEAWADGVRLLQDVDDTDMAHLLEGASAQASSYLSWACAPENLIGGRVNDVGGAFIFGHGDQDQWAKVDLGQVRLLKRIGSAHEGEGMTTRAVWSYFSVETSEDDQEYQEWGHVGPFASWGDSIPSEVYYEVEEAVPVRYILFRYGACYPQSGEGSRAYEVYAFEPEYPSEGLCLSPAMGPASTWEAVAWDESVPASTDLTIDVLGRDPGTGAWQEIPGLQDLTSPSGASMTGVDALRWPVVRLRGNLDTEVLELTPRLDTWWVAWSAVADLAVDAAPDVTPFPPWPDQPCTVRAWLQNAGSAGVPGYAVALWDSTETATQLVESLDLGWTPPGFREEVELVWTPSQGRHVLIVEADPAHTVQESWEGNNRQLVQADVLSNLSFSPESLVIHPQQPVEGDSVTVSCTVTNDGTIAAPPFLVTLGVSGIPTDSTSIAGIEPGHYESVTLRWATGGWWGDVSLEVRLDAGSVVDETSEADNVLSDTVYVLSRSDYGVEGLSVSNTLPPEGDPVLVEVVVGNNGEAAADSARVWFLWRGAGSPDSLFAETWTDTLSGGAADTLHAWWSTLGRVGHDTLSVVVDPLGELPEPDEGNNRAELCIEVLSGVDLVMSPDSLLVVPGSPVKLESSWVHVGVRNASALDVGQSFQVRLLSSESGDLGARIVPGLSGRSTAWLVWDWIPENSGVVAFTAVADSLDNIDETNEYNNQAVVSATVRGWPDLAVRPEDIHFDQLPLRQWDWPESVRVVTRNEGESGADSVVLELFLGDPLGQGVLLSSIQWPQFAASSQETCWLPWQDPPQQGDVSLYAVVDRAGDIAEESEANNVAIRLVQVLVDSVAPLVELAAQDSLAVAGDYLESGSVIRGAVVDSLSFPDPVAVELSLDGSPLGPSQYVSSWDGENRLVIAYTTGHEVGQHTVTLRAGDRAGNWSEAVEFAYSAAQELSVADVYAFPSPASEGTEFTFRVSHDAHARVDLFSLSGRLLRRLEDDVGPPFARIPWDLTDDDGDRVAAGVYIYVLRLAGGGEGRQHVRGRVVVAGR
jgi:subtilase family serine protease